MFNLIDLVKTLGYLGLFGIIFAETGLFVGFFFPGDSLLFTAGILASQGYLNITVLCIILFIAAVSGNTTGYLFGHRVGKKLFRKEDSIFFHKDHLVRAKNFYEKHGGKTIIIARFIPIIRTFAPIVAGIGELSFVKFFIYSSAGALAWAVLLPFIGFYFGKTIKNIDHYILPIVGLIILISILPAIIPLLKDVEKRKRLLFSLTTIFVKKN